MSWKIAPQSGDAAPAPGATGGEWQYDLAHMVEYAVLGALTFFAVRGYRAGLPWLAAALVSWAFAVVYGMSDEFHQSFVPNRDANWMDVGFDALGALLGIAVFKGIRDGWPTRRH